MPFEIELDEEQFKDLISIRELPPEAIGGALRSIEAASQSPIRPTELHEVIRRDGNLDDESAIALIRFSISLLLEAWQSGFELPLEEDQLSGLDEYAFSDEETAKKWETIKPLFLAFLRHDRLAVVAKAIALSYDFANHLARFKILTDIRPVFSSRGDKIVAAVVSQTLRLSYENTEGVHSLSIAIDAETLSNFVGELERAKDKLRAASEQLCEKGIRHLIVGEKVT